mgnify:FL=1
MKFAVLVVLSTDAAILPLSVVGGVNIFRMKGILVKLCVRCVAPYGVLKIFEDKKRVLKAMFSILEFIAFLFSLIGVIYAIFEMG